MVTFSAHTDSRNHSSKSLFARTLILQEKIKTAISERVLAHAKMRGSAIKIQELSKELECLRNQVSAHKQRIAVHQAKQKRLTDSLKNHRLLVLEQQQSIDAQNLLLEQSNDSYTQLNRKIVATDQHLQSNQQKLIQLQTVLQDITKQRDDLKKILAERPQEPPVNQRAARIRRSHYKKRQELVSQVANWYHALLEAHRTQHFTEAATAHAQLRNMTIMRYQFECKVLQWEQKQNADWWIQSAQARRLQQATYNLQRVGYRVSPEGQWIMPLHLQCYSPFHLLPFGMYLSDSVIDTESGVDVWREDEFAYYRGIQQELAQYYRAERGNRTQYRITDSINKRLQIQQHFQTDENNYWIIFNQNLADDILLRGAVVDDARDAINTLSIQLERVNQDILKLNQMLRTTVDAIVLQKLMIEEATREYQAADDTETLLVTRIKQLHARLLKVTQAAKYQAAIEGVAVNPETRMTIAQDLVDTEIATVIQSAWDEYVQEDQAAQYQATIEQVIVDPSTHLTIAQDLVDTQIMEVVQAAIVECTETENEEDIDAELDEAAISQLKLIPDGVFSVTPLLRQFGLFFTSICDSVPKAIKRDSVGMSVSNTQPSIN